MIFIAAPFGNYISSNKTISVKGTFTRAPNGNRLKSIVKTLRYRPALGGWTNKLGLPNPGIYYALQRYSREDVISIAEINQGDFLQMASQIPDDQSLEINISCPNLKDNPTMEYIHLFPNDKREWCICKVGPLTTAEDLEYIISQGYRQIHFSNTLPTQYGGLSGPALRPYTTELIKLMKSINSAVTIIAGGGVQYYSDILQYQLLGADHVSVGSVCFNPYKLYRIFKSA